MAAVVVVSDLVGSAAHRRRRSIAIAEVKSVWDTEDYDEHRTTTSVATSNRCVIM